MMIMSSRTGSIVLISTEQVASVPPRGNCSTDPHPRHAAAKPRWIHARKSDRRARGTSSWLMGFRNERFQLRDMGARRVHFDESTSECNRARSMPCIAVGHERLHLENRRLGTEH